MSTPTPPSAGHPNQGRTLRVAVVRLDNLGDHVLGSGLFRGLRQMYPSSLVTVVIPQLIAGLYRRCPFVDHVITIPPRNSYQKDERQFNDLMEYLNSIPKFDLVISPRYAEDYYHAGLMARALANPEGRIVGFRQASSPIPDYDPNANYTELLDAGDGLHTSKYAGVLLDSAFGYHRDAPPELWLDAKDCEEVRARYQLGARQYVVMGCGASAPYKLPGRDVYAHITQVLSGRWVRKIVLVGDAADREVADAAVAAAGSPSRIQCTVGELELHELGALLADAELYIGPDAGPMHMAAAAGVPVVEIGWVPIDYPAKSKGHLTGGKCWSPRTTRAITVRPCARLFAEKFGRKGWAHEPICGLDIEQIDRALSAMLTL